MPSASFYHVSGFAEHQARLTHRMLVVLIFVLAAITAGSAYFIFGEIDQVMEKNSAAASDNRTWVFSQLEVDLLNLSEAVNDAAQEPEDTQALEKVRTQFDIFYSRVNLINASPELRGIHLKRSTEWQSLYGPDGVLQQWLPVIDGPDASLAAALPALHRTTSELRPAIRQYVVDSVFSVMGQGDATRSELRDTLRLFATVTFVLLMGMALLLAGLFQQSRSRMVHARVLEVALQNLRLTMSSSLDAVMIVNSYGILVGANKAAGDLLGAEIERKLPLISSVLHRNDADNRPVRIEELTPGVRHRLTGVRLDGTTFPAEATVGMGRSENDTPITVVFLRDITELCAREESLAKARNDAMAADEAKARFVAVMSHEMRTPLSGVLSAVDLLARTTAMDDTQVQLVDVIRTCTQATLEQVNNVLLLSRISSAEAGEHPVSVIDIRRFLTDQTQQFVADATRVGTAVNLVGMDHGPIFVSVPVPLLRRAVSNLLANAVKFTPNGLITVDLTTHASERPGYTGLRISISDTGIGIAAEDIERVFRNFESLDVSYARIREGSGLGLGITKLSIEEMGGRIETHSVIGEGSTFTLIFEAPLSDSAAAPACDDHERQVLDAPLSGLSLLLVDDNDINRNLMQRQIETLGAHIAVARDGAEAVCMAKDQSYDLILMDISMPRLDGMQATQMIREGGASQEVPIVALTAQAATPRVKEYFSAGMNDVLVKPARIDRLVEVILAQVTAAVSPDIIVSRTAPGHRTQETGVFQDLVDDLGRDFMIKMVEDFITETEASLRQAEASKRSGDLKNTQRLAHASCGAAAVLGLENLADVFRTLENAAAAGRLGEIDVLFAEAQTLLAAGGAALKAQLTRT